MDFQDSPDEAAFRHEVRSWLEANIGEYRDAPAIAWTEEEFVQRARAWQKVKADAGFGAILWPAKLGGRGGTPMQAVIFAEEEARHHAPTGIFIKIGMVNAMPTIMKHGSPEQLDRFAGPSLRGEIAWAQLFSEPAAGSDLANLRTRAVRDGDRWIVNGQKVWSSWAHHSDWGILLCRTDPEVPKHKGITCFVLDMKSPGIELRPIRQISGKADFNETFLTDVVIPDSDRIGDVGSGWSCAMTTLTGERISAGTEVRSNISQLIQAAASVQRDEHSVLESSAEREHLARLYSREQGLRYFRFRMLTQLSKGNAAGAEAGLAKLAYASLLQESSAFAMGLRGYAGMFESDQDPGRQEVIEDYYWSSVLRIAGGSDEVLRNQLAERVLGQPGDPRADKNVPFNQVAGSR